MPKVKCAGKSCQNTKQNRPDLTFHRFPLSSENLDRLQEWKKFSGTEDLTERQLENKRICDEHFVSSDYQNRGDKKRVLTDRSYPKDISGTNPNKRVAIDFQFSSSNNSNNENSSPNSAASENACLTNTPSNKALVTNNINSSLSEDNAKVVDVDPLIETLAILNTLDDRSKIVESTTDNHSFHTTDTSNVNQLVSSSAAFESDTHTHNTSLISSNKFSFLNDTCSTDSHSETVPSNSIQNEPNKRKKFGTIRKLMLNKRKSHLAKLIRKNKNLTSESKKIFLQENNKLCAKIKSLQQKIRRLEIKNKIPLDKDQAFDAIKPYLNKNATIFIQMQLNHSNQKRKWEDDEKYFSLGLYYKSPKAYRYLKEQKELAFPCLSLMKQWVNEITLKPGINTDLMKLLTKKRETMTEYEIECVLMFDEMKVRPNLQYNEKDDYIEGFQDIANHGRKDELATSAFSAMITGLSHNWKQPFYFAFSKGPITGVTLKKIILELLDTVEETGLKVRMIVCDQSGPNQKAITDLGVTIEKPFITRFGRNIFVNYDGPHVMKCWRNNLLVNNFSIYDPETNEYKIVSWDAIRELRELERYKSCRAAPKLTDRHIDPNKFQRMNVKLAVQVFSGSVARAMRAGISTNELKHEHSAATADFIWEMDQIFDCINGRNFNDRNPFRRGLCDKNPLVENTLRKALKWLENIEMLDGKSSRVTKSPDCFGNLQLTINSFLLFWEELRKQNRYYLLTGKCNQDPQENFFAFNRAASGWNLNPTPQQFRKGFQHGMVTSLLRSPSGANCESDNNTNLLTDFKTVVKEQKERRVNEQLHDSDIEALLETWVSSEYFEDSNVLDDDSTDDDALTQPVPATLEKCSMKYVAGYLIKACMKKLKKKCSDCEKTLLRGNQNLEQSNDLLLFWKAYKVAEKDLGNLKVPSDNFTAVIEKAYDIFDSNFELHWTEYNIKTLLIARIQKSLLHKDSIYKDFWENSVCQEHRNSIIKLFVRMHIFYFLKWASKDHRDSVAPTQSNAAAKPNQKLQILQQSR